MTELTEAVQGVLVREHFFKGYKKPRYVAHDRIHHWVATSLGLSHPTVDAVLSDHTQVHPQNFHQLQQSQKESIFIEEALVLGMERFLIKNIAESKQATDSIWEHYFNSKQENPSVEKLKELCIPGTIKDHPDWMAYWGMEHQKILMPQLKTSLVKLRDNYPKSLKQYLMILERTKERQAAPHNLPLLPHQSIPSTPKNLSFSKKISTFKKGSIASIVGLSIFAMKKRWEDTNPPPEFNHSPQ